MEVNIGEIIVDEEIEIGGLELDIIKEYPSLENLTVTPTGEQQIFNHPNSYGYDNVTVKAVKMQNKEVTPTTEEQILVPDSDYSGFNQVTIGAVTKEIDSNIVAENIKDGVDILGVIGTLTGSSGGGETSSITNDERFLINAIAEPTNTEDLSYSFQNWTNLIKLDLTYYEIDVEFTPIYGMFLGCTNLVALALSDSLCDRINTMEMNGETDAIEEIFEGVPVKRDDIGYIYVSEEKYWEYRNSRGWSSSYNLKSMSEW